MLITVTKGCDTYAASEETCNCSMLLDGSSVQNADKAMCLELNTDRRQYLQSLLHLVCTADKYLYISHHLLSCLFQFVEGANHKQIQNVPLTT